MIIIFEKIISIFIIILIGYVVCRLGWLPKESGKYISRIIMNISLPCLVLYSTSQHTLDMALLKNLVITGVLVVILFTGGTFLGLWIAKLMKIPVEHRGVYGFSLGYSNNGFLGFPVAQVFFGPEGLLFMVISNIVMNIHTFSMGLWTINYGDKVKKSMKDRMKRLFNVPVVASLVGLALLVAGVDIPEVPSDILSMLGNMTTPLSMIFLGMQLAQSKVRDVAGVKINYVITIFRLVVLPVIFYFICVLLGTAPMVTNTVVLNAGFPIAVVVSILCEEYNRNTKLAAECVFLSTLCSLVTLPVMLLLLNTFV